ncbi:chaplin family protein [Nonomuraea sp. H19]|uniref:chaplin family protein n=1 Tax=Nonomuraea sp. H19 TaxID=3452206 RepID=UPI003F8A06FA
MRTWAKASTPAALLAVAVMSFGGSGTALADTSGDASIGGGNQVDLPISLPIDISGNSVAAAGSADASSQGGAEVVNHGRSGIPNRTSGDASIGGGNQVNAPITAPINACGNAVSLFGKSDAGCKGGATVRNQGKGGAGGNRTSGDASVLGGNQITAPITAPLNACGNAVAIFGDATAGCKGGSSVHNAGVGGGNSTSGEAGVLGGNQVVAPITAPVDICGNSAAVVGRAFAGCKGGSSVNKGHGYHSRRITPGSTGNDTDGRFAAGSGNQVIAPISLPVDVCGNAVGNSSAGCKGGASVDGGSGAGGNHTSGKAGVLSGNQVVAPIAAPVNICGNTAAVLGHAFAGCKGGASVKSSAGGGNHTSGKAGVLSGNQVVAPIAAPVNACGNAVAVLGDAAAGCLGGAHVGKPGHHGHGGYGRFAQAGSKATAAKGGLLPALPTGPALGGLQGVPALGALQEATGVTQQVENVARTAQLPDVSGVTRQVPLVADASKTLGLPNLPELPGLPAQAQTPARPKTALAGHTDRAGSVRSVSPLAPATDLVASTPAGGAVNSVAKGLPIGAVGLMSAEQPAGVTGMNSSSLLALVLGAMFAASATLFASARRLRFGRK